MSYLKYIEEIEEIDISKKIQFQKHFDKKAKPLDSLGKLETIGAQIAGIKGKLNYSLKRKKHFVFAGDNGVELEEVSSCPRVYTKVISETMLEGRAAISLLCKCYNVDFVLVDVGIDGDIEGEFSNFLNKKVSKGTKNIKDEAAMSEIQLDKIFKEIFDLVEENAKSSDILSCGEMGIGNTSTSAAIIYKILGGDLDLIVGYGSGITEKMINKKKTVILESCNRFESVNPMEILKQLGGYDIAAMTAFYLACAYYKIPVILDGYISMAAALVAYEINPFVKNYLIPSHRTRETGALLVYRHLGIEPVLYMDMGLGEGTGAILLYPLLEGIMPLYKKMFSKKQIDKRLG